MKVWDDEAIYQQITSPELIARILCANVDVGQPPGFTQWLTWLNSFVILPGHTFDYTFIGCAVSTIKFLQILLAFVVYTHTWLSLETQKYVN